MVIELFTLFFSSLLGGLVVVVQRTMATHVLGKLLNFSGGYLFATTLLHLMPEIFASDVKPLHIGGYVMIGFFFQAFIETFSEGVAHGHSMAPMPQHKRDNPVKFLAFLSAIALHALLDGTILCMHSHNGQHLQKGLLFGMILHKFVESFALMSVLRGLTQSFRYSLFGLVLFALAAPLGLLLSSYANHYFGMNGNILSAIVTGNFLYISATMLFEASPDHHLNLYTRLVSFMGAGFAALIEFLS